jgi:hypothetical protein
MNHSDTPNLYDTPDNLQELASRDIEVGEELTCNYFLFDLHAAEKLGQGKYKLAIHTRSDLATR